LPKEVFVERIEFVRINIYFLLIKVVGREKVKISLFNTSFLFFWRVLVFGFGVTFDLVEVRVGG